MERVLGRVERSETHLFCLGGCGGLRPPKAVFTHPTILIWSEPGASLEKGGSYGHNALCPYTAWSGCSKLPICKYHSLLSLPQVERGVHGGRDSSLKLRMTQGTRSTTRCVTPTLRDGSHDASSRHGMTQGTEGAQLCAPTKNPPIPSLVWDRDKFRKGGTYPPHSYLSQRGEKILGEATSPLRINGHNALCPYTAWSGCSKLPICKSPSLLSLPQVERGLGTGDEILR